LVDNNNYTVVKTITVNGNQPIAAAFTPSVTTTTTNTDVAFNSSTQGASDYYWDFGDGTTATGQNAIHSYSDTGTYTVTLIVVSAGGCTNTASQTVSVSELTGISNIGNTSSINIWSSDNRVYIDFSKQNKVEAEVEIYNVIGQQLVNEKYGRSTIYSKPIDNLEAAYVIVKVKNDGITTTRRVFIGSAK
jgi:PKD repeat protein